MATKRTRFKGRKTPQFTGGKVSKGAAASTQARMNNAGTPTSRSRIGKPVAGKANPRQNLVKTEHKAPTRTRKTKAGVRTNRKSPWTDEYEFNETDDVITGNSLLSASFSASSSKKTVKNQTLTNVKSKKSNLTNQQKGIQKKVPSQHAGPEGNKKKTSTPLSEVTNQVPTGKPGKRYMQISVPKLDLDSVTPILPISTDQSLSLTTGVSLRQKAGKRSNTKSVSFEDLKEPLPAQTPAGKTSKRTRRQLAVANNLSSFSASGSFKEPAPALAPVSATATSVQRKTDRKRKGSEPTSSIQSQEATAPAKRKKTDLSKTKRPLVTSRKASISPQSKPTKKRTRLQPVASTPALPPWDKQLKDGQTGQSPPVYDSGISMGDDLSTSEDRYSAEATPLPGFMEDEPMQDSMDHLGDSPLSAPTSNPSSKEVLVYKSAVKTYKAAKTKREKGRYSTSKVDAWADAVNQSLQDVESFELVVE